MEDGHGNKKRFGSGCAGSRQKHLTALRKQILDLQAQTQQFVDGVLVGMGVDLSTNPTVDLETMTITIKTKDEEKDGSKS
jgi:hypothetical protein